MGVILKKLLDRRTLFRRAAVAVSITHKVIWELGCVERCKDLG